MRDTLTMLVDGRGFGPWRRRLARGAALAAVVGSVASTSLPRFVADVDAPTQRREAIRWSDDYLRDPLPNERRWHEARAMAQRIIAGLHERRSVLLDHTLTFLLDRNADIALAYAIERQLQSGHRGDVGCLAGVVRDAREGAALAVSGALLLDGVGSFPSWTDAEQIGSNSNYGGDAQVLMRVNAPTCTNAQDPNNPSDTVWRVGVVAWHTNGVDRVEATLNGGVVQTVRAVTFNGRTAAWEHQFAIDLSTLSSAAMREIRFRGVPVGNGKTRVSGPYGTSERLPKFEAYCSNNLSDYTPTRRWVDPNNDTGLASNSNDALTETTPWLTTGYAIDQARGIANLEILLMGQHTSNTFASCNSTIPVVENQNARYVRIVPAPAAGSFGGATAASAAVKIWGATASIYAIRRTWFEVNIDLMEEGVFPYWSGLQAGRKVVGRNITIKHHSSITPPAPSSHWGAWKSSQFQDAGGAWLIGCTLGPSFFLGAGTGTARQCNVTDIAAQAFRDADLIVNCVAENVHRYDVTNDHGDGIQYSQHIQYNSLFVNVNIWEQADGAIRCGINGGHIVFINYGCWIDDYTAGLGSDSTVGAPSSSLAIAHVGLVLCAFPRSPFLMQWDTGTNGDTWKGCAVRDCRFKWFGASLNSPGEIDIRNIRCLQNTWACSTEHPSGTDLATLKANVNVPWRNECGIDPSLTESSGGSSVAATLWFVDAANGDFTPVEGSAGTASVASSDIGYDLNNEVRVFPTAANPVKAVSEVEIPGVVETSITMRPSLVEMVSGAAADWYHVGAPGLTQALADDDDAFIEAIIGGGVNSQGSESNILRMRFVGEEGNTSALNRVTIHLWVSNPDAEPCRIKAGSVVAYMSDVLDASEPDSVVTTNFPSGWTLFSMRWTGLSFTGAALDPDLLGEASVYLVVEDPNGGGATQDARPRIQFVELVADRVSAPNRRTGFSVPVLAAILEEEGA